MKKHYAIYGASGFGREVLPLLKKTLSHTDKNQYSISFVDDASDDTILNNCPVFSYSNWLKLPGEKYICLAIANSNIRELLQEKCVTDKIQFIDLKSETVIQYDDVVIGTGSVLCANVTLTSNIRIGKQFHANIYSYIGHDCVVGDYVTFAPSVKCNGNIIIEDHAYIGTGAIIKQGKPGSPLIIGKGAVIGMGAVVTKSVPTGVTVVGNPARPLSKEEFRK
jgi:sugar O-acyltransferase (sialic acid O-acetyltransferase NeuD family)